MGPTSAQAATPEPAAAFEAFFSGMPADAAPGMAFVLVQHLAPDHKSLLIDLIRRCTTLPLFEVEDGMEVQVNCACIIPRSGRCMPPPQPPPSGPRSRARHDDRAG